MIMDVSIVEKAIPKSTWKRTNCDNKELERDDVKSERIYCECHIADLLQLASHGVSEVAEGEISRIETPEVVSLVLLSIEAEEVRAFRQGNGDIWTLEGRILKKIRLLTTRV